MLNAERFKKEILEKSNVVFDFSISKDRHTIEKCLGVCDNCIFFNMGEHCSNVKVKWLLSEYKEPVKLSRFEHEYLERISNHSKFRYIARDEIGCIFAYENKPRKYSNHWNVIIEGGALARLPLCDDLYQFMSWEDQEPTPIKDVLENCEVVNDAEE